MDGSIRSWRRLWWFLFLLLCASCEDGMKAGDLQLVEEYGAGGIDQSDNPRKASIYEGVNVSSNKGYWTNRPGWQEMNQPLGGFTATLLAEYKYNHEFAQSYYNAVLVSRNSGTSAHFVEILNQVDMNTLTPPTGSTSIGDHKRWSCVQGIARDASASEPRNYYVPCLLIGNGEDDPLLYHQMGGTGQLSKLNSVDGGDTSLSYLTEPPKAKYYVEHQGKIFALNIDTDPTAFFYTGLYQNAAQVVNVWPASYYGNAGSGKPITGGISWGGNLALFKEDEIWIVTGDGEPYAITKVDSEHGAFNQFCLVDVGDSVIFMGKGGIYRWNGGQAVNISHPRLQKLWSQLNWSETGKKRFYGVYDSVARRVIFGVGAQSGIIDGAIVYNLDTDTFDYWGSWLGKARDYLYGFGWPEVMTEIGVFSAEQPFLMGLIIGYLCRLQGNSDKLIGSQYPIHWFMQTQRYFTNDSQSKLLRQMMVRAKKTGDWQLSLLALVDGENPQDALHRDTAGKHNIIVDSTNATTHEVDGTSQFQASTDGPVDVFFMPMMYKLWDSKAITTATNPDEIEFTAAQDSTGKGGLLLVTEEDKSPMVFFTMYDTGDAIFDDAGTTYDDARFLDPEFEKLITAENAIGRSFALWISNVGSYNSGLLYWAKTGMPMEIDGWGFWVRPRGVLRL